MLAAVTQSPGVLTLDELPDPGPPGPQEVLIRPEVVGICGSDLHVYHGELGALSGARSFFPRVQGHEFSAIIEAAGQDCPAGLRPGDRVAVWPLRACGRCYPCRVGRPNACVSLELYGIHRNGGLQERLCVPAGQVFRVGDLSAEAAAFIEPMSIAVHARQRAELRAGQRVAVLGAGPIGLAMVLAARAAGARVLAVDPLPGRRCLATRLGAEQVAWGSPADGDRRHPGLGPRRGPAAGHRHHRRSGRAGPGGRRGVRGGPGRGGRHVRREPRRCGRACSRRRRSTSSGPVARPRLTSPPRPGWCTRTRRRWPRCSPTASR